VVPSGGAAAERDELDQFANRCIEALLELDVGYAIDLPADTSQLAVAPLVALGVEATAVPCHVVDLHGPPDIRESSVGMDRDAIR